MVDINKRLQNAAMHGHEGCVGILLPVSDP